MPSLYIVATPIGNMEDITLRALRVLREVGLVAAEDTRRTGRLLSAHGIRTPLTSYHEHNENAKLSFILGRLEETDVALVCNAGMPIISDPGYELVRAAAEMGISVVPVPGPSAVMAAMAVSGLPADRFLYMGFLPRRKGKRRRRLEEVATLPYTLVVFETRHRLRASLADILDILGDRPLAVCRELTKLHEEILRGQVGQAIEHFQEPRGEFTLVIGGADQGDL